MCKAILSLAEKMSLETVVSQDSAKRERRRLRKIFKDISRRCALPVSGIDATEFLKLTDLPGLLGQQFFKAFDVSHSEFLSQSDFLSGILTLYKGSYADITSMLFSLLEFNQEGYVTMDATRMLMKYLPLDCRKCGHRISLPWTIEEKIAAVFGEHPVLSKDDLVGVMLKQREYFDLLYTVLLNSFPDVIDEAMARDRNCHSDHITQRKSLDVASRPDTTLTPLKFEGRRYYFELANKALYYYRSCDRGHVKGVILLEGLFVRPVGGVGFELKNGRFTYCFEAGTEAERDEWITAIHESVNYRWFDDYYETRESLGSGAYGQVLKVIERGTGRVAAVKIISKEGMDIKGEQRIRREIDILRLVRHDNLLRLIDVFETGDRIYLVTDLIAGGPLFTWLESQNFQIPESTARSITIDISKALCYLHSCGIIHRDIKLENVLLEVSGFTVKAKLIDYGLSCFLGPGETTNEPVGTLKYVAPEIISRMVYREKIDCWSLGVIVFILLQGTVPFFGKNDQEVAMRILRKKLRFDSEKWQSVSIQARAVLEGLLNRKPDRRLSLSDVLRSEWLMEDEDDTDDTGIAIPRSLELTTPFQSRFSI